MKNALAILLISSTLTPLLHAGEVTDEFDDGLVDSSLWTIAESGNGPTAVEANGRYRINVPSTSSGSRIGEGLQYNEVLTGDFDARVDYYLDEWPSTNGLRVGFDVFETDDLVAGVMNMIRFGRGIAIDSPGVPSQAYLSSAEQVAPGTSVSTTDLEGRLRLARNGSSYSSYYAAIGTEDWVLLDQFNGTFADLVLTVQAYTGDNVFTQ